MLRYATLGSLLCLLVSCSTPPRAVMVTGQTAQEDLAKIVGETFQDQGFRLLGWDDSRTVMRFGSDETRTVDESITKVGKARISGGAGGYMVSLYVFTQAADLERDKEVDFEEGEEDIAMGLHMRNLLVHKLQGRGISAQVAE